MGEIAGRLADVVVITAEDPRSEDVNEIINEIAKGITSSKKIHKVLDRGEAIKYAINKVAKKGDLVIICGKGHEKSMAYGRIEHPWSDVEAVKLALDTKTRI